MEPLIGGTEKTKKRTVPRCSGVRFFFRLSLVLLDWFDGITANNHFYTSIFLTALRGFI